MPWDGKSGWEVSVHSNPSRLVHLARLITPTWDCIPVLCQELRMRTDRPRNHLASTEPFTLITFGSSCHGKPLGNSSQDCCNGVWILTSVLNALVRRPNQTSNVLKRSWKPFSLKTIPSTVCTRALQTPTCTGFFLCNKLTLSEYVGTVSLSLNSSWKMFSVVSE